MVTRMFRVAEPSSAAVCYRRLRCCALRCGSGRAAVRAYQHLRDSTNLLLSITLFCVLLYSHACCADSVLAICGCTYYCKTLSVYIKIGNGGVRAPRRCTQTGPMGTHWDIRLLAEWSLRCERIGEECLVGYLAAFANFLFNTCFLQHTWSINASSQQHTWSINASSQGQ